jgi:hypothetical protein
LENVKELILSLRWQHMQKLHKFLVVLRFLRNEVSWEFFEIDRVYYVIRFIIDTSMLKILPDDIRSRHGFLSVELKERLSLDIPEFFDIVLSEECLQSGVFLSDVIMGSALNVFEESD